MKKWGLYVLVGALVLTGLLYWSPLAKLTPLRFLKNNTLNLKNQETERLKKMKPFVNVDGTVLETGVKLRQDGNDFRTVEVSGFVTRVLEQDGWWQMEMWLPTGVGGEESKTVVIALGGEKSKIGVYRAFNNVMGRKREWGNETAMAVAKSLKVDNQVVAEVIVWIDESVGCKSEGCTATMEVYGARRLGNLTMAEAVREARGGNGQGYLPETVEVGPVVSMMLEK